MTAEECLVAAERAETYAALHGGDWFCVPHPVIAAPLDIYTYAQMSEEDQKAYRPFG
jgi:hypothetical protein